jgi:hypothetical protein
MKLEIVKKTDVDNVIVYYIKKNGSAVIGSVCAGRDALKKVMDIFENLKIGGVPKEEVILVEEI